MSATLVGTSFDGARLERPTLWSAVVPWAEVTWPGVRWRKTASCLRGAIALAMGGEAAHIDFHGHIDATTTRQGAPPVSYRVVDGAPVVHLHGPRVHDHLGALARLPAFDGAACGAPVLRAGETEAQILGKTWRRYELVSPYFPSHVVYGRRPRTAGVEQRAWAAQALAVSLTQFADGVGVGGGDHPIHVQIAEMRTERVAFKEAKRHGFLAAFVANVVVPPGLALGGHRSVGFGVVQPCL